MKNNKALIIIGVVLINILVIFMLGKNLTGASSKYDIALEKARSFAENELYSRAIDAYGEAAVQEDSLELRLEMVETYAKGLKTSEFDTPYVVFSAIQEYVELYPKEPAIYEAVCGLMLDYAEYEACAKLMMQARDLYVTSDVLTEILAQIRYKYDTHFSMYVEVRPDFDGMYVAKKDVFYGYLNAEGTRELDSIYTYASAFAEGYAFVKLTDLDGTERNVIINTEGQRQAYLKDVETCSGAGYALDEKGNVRLLFACKIGDTYQYVDLNGEKVLGDYVYAGRFRNNVAAVQEADGKWKLIDGSGKQIGDKTFADIVLNEFEECAPKGLIIAKNGNKYHIYNIKGQQVGDFSCDGAKAFVDSYAAFRSGDGWGFVDAQGNVIIEAQYADAKSFSNGVAGIYTDSGWSLINESNELITQDVFQDVLYLSDTGLIFVKTNEYWSYLSMYYIGK